jgi:hypothetical protein
MLADAGLQAAGRSQIHFAAKQRLEVILQSEQAEVSDGAVEFDEQIHVTGGISFIARNRTEEGQGPDAKLLS